MDKMDKIDKTDKTKKNAKTEKTEKAKYYSSVCSKIGLALILFYIFFTMSAFGLALLEEAAAVLASGFAVEAFFEVASAIFYFLSFSAAAFILRKLCKKLPSARKIYTSFRLDKWVFIGIIAIIAVNFTLAYVNTNILITVSPMLESSMSSSASELASRPIAEIAVLFLIAIFSTAIVPAVCEEYLFRGGVLTALLPFGKTTAILASALLFGLMHQNPLQILYTTIMGVVIGYIYVETKSIWACMLLHFANNFITVLEEFLPALTKIYWLSTAIDFVVLAVGAVALFVILLKKDKEPDEANEGSYGKIYDIGMDVEEYELDLSRGEKLKRFFAPTVIIFSIVCAFSILSTLLSFLNINIQLPL